MSSLEKKNVEFKYLPLKKLKVWSRVNVRKTDAYVGIEDLTDNVKEIGIQLPLIVVKSGKNYRIVSGQRRYIAAGKAKLKEVPCIIRKDLDDPVKATIFSFSENVYRQDMTEEDKSNAAYTLLQKLKSEEEVAARLGVTVHTIKKYLAFRSVPDKIKKLVNSHKVSSETAREINKQFGYDEEFAYELAKSYANRKKGEKSDFYSAIKSSKKTDTLKDIESTYKKIKSSDAYTIRLPLTSSHLVKKIATQNHSTAAVIIVQLVERSLELFKKGKMRF